MTISNQNNKVSQTGEEKTPGNTVVQDKTITPGDSASTASGSPLNTAGPQNSTAATPSEEIDPATWAKLIGSTGNYITAGYLMDEHISALQRTGWAIVIEEMTRSDEIISSLSLAFIAPLLGASWDFDPPIKVSEEEQDAEKIAAAVRSKKSAELCRWAFFENMYKTWTEFLFEFFDTIVTAGYYLGCPLTKVEEYCPVTEKYAWVFKDFSYRSPKTIYRWDTDEEDQLKAVWQMAPLNNRPFVGWIPAEKVMHVALGKKGTNFEGKSPFRGAYGNYYRKKLLQKVKLIAAERAGLGFPVAKYPDEWKEGSDEYAALKEFAKNITSNGKAYGLLPKSVDLQDFEIPAKLEELDKIIQNENRNMTYVILCDWLMMGSSGTAGSRAANEDKTRNFLTSWKFLPRLFIEKMKKYIDQVAFWNIPDIKKEEICTLTVTGIESKVIEAIMEMVCNLVDKGVLTEGDDIEDWVRKQIEAPKRMTSRRDKVNDGEEPGEAEAAVAGAGAEGQGEEAVAGQEGQPGAKSGAQGPQKAQGQGKGAAAPVKPAQKGTTGPNNPARGAKAQPAKKEPDPAKKPVKDDLKALPQAGKITKLAQIPAGPIGYHRALSKYEEKVNFKAMLVDILTAQDDYNSMMKAQLAAIAEKYIAELRKRVIKDGGDIRKVLPALEMPGLPELTQAITAKLKEIMLTGGKQIEQEIKKKAKFALEPDKLSPGAYAWVKSKAEQLSKDKLHDLQKAMINAADGLASKYPLNKSIEQAQENAIISEARSAAMDYYDSDYNLGGNIVPSMAMNAGRKEASEENGVIGFENSSVIDDATTEECLELDGQTRAIDDYESAKLDPPGHFGCRRVLIPITAEEGEPEGGFTGFYV